MLLLLTRLLTAEGISQKASVGLSRTSIIAAFQPWIGQNQPALNITDSTNCLVSSKPFLPCDVESNVSDGSIVKVYETAISLIVLTLGVISMRVKLPAVGVKVIPVSAYSMVKP